MPFSAKLHWNKPTALRLAFITKGTYLRPKKELFLLLKKSNKTLKQKKILKLTAIKINKHQNKKSSTHLHSKIMRYSWRKTDFFKHFLFSRSKTNFLKFSFVIDDRFDRKISKPTANNLSTEAELLYK